MESDTPDSKRIRSASANREEQVRRRFVREFGAYPKRTSVGQPRKARLFPPVAARGSAADAADAADAAVAAVAAVGR